DREPDPAARLSLIAARQPHELLEHPVRLARRDPRPGVRYLDRHPWFDLLVRAGIRSGRLHADHSAHGGEFDRVADEVVDDPPNAAGIGGDRELRWHVQANLDPRAGGDLSLGLADGS